ncbi:histidine kinase dimerization/phospho-acceptor domain-containing protein [Vibrio sp. PP-XX7]
MSKGEMNVSVTTSGSDEISEVARAFNEMSSRLKLAAEIRKTHEQELESLNHTLESRVERRTEALKRTHDQLIHSEKMASIGTLVAGVAHEINNPIGFVMSNIRMLAQYIPIYSEVIEKLKAIALLQTDQEVHNALSELNHWLEQKNITIIQEDIGEIISDTMQGIERIETIVTGLKEFSHVDQDKSHKLTNLNEAIERTLQVTKNELKYKAETNVELSNIPLVNCNIEQIQQVLLNLIINASHAIERDGLICIRSWAENDQVFISVARQWEWH